MGIRSRVSRHTGLAAGMLFVGMTAAACAARQPPSMADRFVRPGGDDAEFVELLPRDEASTAQPEPERLDLPEGVELGRVTPKTVEGVTVERSDTVLADALAAYAAEPGVETALAVALEYHRLRIWDAADDFLILALKDAPRDARLWAARARVWRDWGLPDLALGHATRAVYFSPDSVDALNTMGTVLTMVGQFDAARGRFESALALEPDGAYLLSNLCYLEIAAARPEQARARCEAALAIDPSLEVARENLARIGRHLERRHSEQPYG